MTISHSGLLFGPPCMSGVWTGTLSQNNGWWERM